MFRILQMFLLVVVSGCVTAITDTLSDIPKHTDLSTVSASAVIKGSTDGVMEPNTCHIDSPARTMELILDAGIVSITVQCFGYGEYGRTKSVFAGITFVADAGHTYRLGRTSGNAEGFRGVDLIDTTKKKRVVARRPVFYTKGAAARSISMAYVFTGYNAFNAAPGDVRCQLTLPREASTAHHVIQTSGYSTRYFVEPGPAMFTVTCTEWSSSFGPLKSKVKNRYVSDVEFDVEANHSYALGLQSRGTNCIYVADITTRSPQQLICQAAKQSDESQGLTRVEICAGPKKSCKEMASCAEAMKYMNCGLIGLDGDFDGDPCDSICRQ